MNVLAISPHLDDAVFSAGGTLWERVRAGDRVTVLTCFTGNVAEPSDFALACQLDKGVAADIDYMELRRKEDELACLAIGARPVHLPLLEAPHRGYDSAAALFGTRLAKDDALPRLTEALRAAFDCEQPGMIYAPFGIGGHVDHLIVREAVEAARADLPVSWWEDYPYAMNLEARPEIVRRDLSPGAQAAKLRATLAYKSQLGFQFGGLAEAEEALGAWLVEGFATG
jgi:LmbE family N-acetylglucosaminyl deacetylase